MKLLCVLAYLVGLRRLLALLLAAMCLAILQRHRPTRAPSAETDRPHADSLRHGGGTSREG